MRIRRCQRHDQQDQLEGAEQDHQPDCEPEPESISLAAVRVERGQSAAKQ